MGQATSTLLISPPLDATWMLLDATIAIHTLPCPLINLPKSRLLPAEPAKT